MNKHHLTWNESRHSIGIALVDSQHRAIIERVNHVADSVAKRNHSEVVQEILRGLILVTREHFDLEERLMAEHSFPGMGSHIEEHRLLLQQLDNLIKKDLRALHHIEAALVSAFLTDWVEHHILQADQELGEFLAAKGLS